LYFYDTQDPALVGLKEEFLASSRLDNLLSCFVGVSALAHASTKMPAVLVCSDHEEVGSASAQGAQGPFLKAILERLCGTQENFARAMSRSLLISTDNAHGIHPSYPDRHESSHAPILNQGPAIKTNTNQRYATSAETAAVFLECCAEAKVPVQNFVARNDMPCGSTIGPITATLLGVKTVDVGIPTFAMHSIRELSGTQDSGYLAGALKVFFRHPGLD
jgi:aspartyl aminopeptidase